MFCSMNIPLSDDPEKAFNDIIDTFMGEYSVTMRKDEMTALGEWTRYIFSTKPLYTRTAWIEDENGNITDYFIQTSPETMIHRTV